MPDKIFKSGCGPACIRCWKNNLKHANPETKKYMKKHGIEKLDISSFEPDGIRGRDIPKRNRLFQLKKPREPVSDE